MKKKILSMLSAFVLIASLACVSVPNVSAAGKAEYTIRFACISSETTTIGSQSIMNFNYAGMLAFKNYVESASGGRIAVELYTNAALGNAQEILTQCMQGVLEVCTLGDADISNYYPEMQVFSIPYTFSDRMEFYNFLDSSYHAQLTELLVDELGVRIISSFDNGGFRNFSNNVRPIKTAADVNGLKIRCMQSSAHLATMTALGAVPTALNFSELYSALQTGVVDGQENSPLVMFDNSIYEQQKYYTLDGHMISPAYFVCNEKWLRSLPEDLQKVVLDGGKMGQVASRGTIASGEGIALNLLNEAGLDVYAPTAKEKETFKVAQEPVLKWLRDEIGDEPVDAFLKAVNEVKLSGDSTVVLAGSGQATASSTGYVVAIAVLGLMVIVLAVLAFRRKKVDVQS